VAGVSWPHSAYTDARQQLQRLGLSPNAAFNGVELDSQLHAVIHTDAVGRALEDVLRSQNHAAEAQESLGALAQFLYSQSDRVSSDLTTLAARQKWAAEEVTAFIRGLSRTTQ
jgi:hypothetical protein